MSRFPIVILAAALLAPSRMPGADKAFDAGWRFLKSDAVGAEKPEFDDSAWRPVDVPHDWSIEGPFDEKNATGGAGGFLPAGVGWYRKHFALPAGPAGQHVFIEFDGVMANSDVWINGYHLGKRPYGYVSFEYDLTGHLKLGDEKANVLAVRADNLGQPASRWYTGAGIYRHVRLAVEEPVHAEHWSTFVTTPRVSAAEATVRVESRMVNQSEQARSVRLQIRILDTHGRAVGSAETAPQTVAAGNSADYAAEITVKNPDRWDIGHGALYRAEVKVVDGGTSPAIVAVVFGIREFHFDADTGFWINGRNLKIKGAAMHHDGGAVGAAVPLRVWERRLELLRQIGVNAIRTAHNPAAPEFLALCDRMGFLVMDEMFDCWAGAKNAYDYHLYFNEWSKADTRDTVRRDRNHPSIILYSAGNEIRDTPKADLAKEILSGLVEVFHANDATRPVTQALFRPNVSHDYDDGLADLLDVVGQNYRENELLAAHAAKPTRKIVGTENQLGRPVWLALRDNAEYSGQFLWAGFDYLGESHQWPQVVSASGLFDRTGGFKPAAYERQSWWADAPMVYMARRVARPPASPTDPGYQTTFRLPVETLFSDWTPAKLEAHEESVEVYSNCEEVELLLNGKPLGSKRMPADASPRTWVVPFETGSLKAVGKNKGTIAATYELQTAAKAARVVLSADRTSIGANWDDVATITATVVDEKGVPVPGADESITFQVTGPGVVAAVDSADLTSHEAFQARERHAYQGRCIAMVKAKATGRITVTGAAAGLVGSTVSLAASGEN
jgi:beta-galactosidase